MEILNKQFEIVNDILVVMSDFLYSYILIFLLMLGGLFFTFKMGFVQLKLIPEAIKQIIDKGDGKNKKGVSSFQALMISTASRVGVGNISGVATAIAIGGSGAVFWMWLIALIGAASAFVESTLAQVYKVKHGDSFRGGPSYYIQKALKQRWLGVLFSICLIACFGFGFNPLQSNNITSSLEYYFGKYDSLLIPASIGIVLALLTAYIIFGGERKIAIITSVIVPIMASIYLILGIVVILKNIQILPELFTQIFKNAFDFTAIFGGFSGSCVLQGIKRGLFSNEAGMGSAPNAAASANVSHPVKQGLVQMISVFIDTLLICTTSAFIILLSNVDTTGLKAMPIVQKAMYTQFGEMGILFITISVFFFAFTSIIGNYYYTESNMLFILKGKSSLVIYKLIIILAVFWGSIAGYDLVWNLADVLMGIMASINVVVILMLSKTAKKALDDYMAQKKQGKNPVFVAKELNIENTEVWN